MWLSTVFFILPCTRIQCCCCYERLSVNLILGAPEDDAGGSSSIADTGGLVASGDGTAGNPNEPDGPRLNPRFCMPGAGGVLAAPGTGVAAVGTLTLLNSAQRGHLRLVSAAVV